MRVILPGASGMVGQGVLRECRRDPATARGTREGGLDRAVEIHGRYRLLDSLAIEYHEPDWAGLPILASRWALSAYDAAYLQLALGRKAVLVTLDARLAAAWDHATARG